MANFSMRPDARPYVLLVTIFIFFCLLDGWNFISPATFYNAFQMFAAFGLVALGLGLTMMVGEFDLSVAGLYGLSGCIAVIIGNDNPALGLLCALLICSLFGTLQGYLIIRLSLGSVPVSLAGLLISTGCAFLVTNNQSLSFDNIDLALALNDRFAGFVSMRSAICIAIFVVAAGVVSGTRIGRDLIATGSNRKAAQISGVPVNKFVVGTFTTSAFLAALSGAMLSYGLASASPSGLSEVLVPAIAATILGGVSLAGGVGSPIGIAAGVLSLTVLRAGLNALAVPPFVHDVVTGIVLLTVAIADGPHLARTFKAVKIWS